MSACHPSCFPVRDCVRYDLECPFLERYSHNASHHQYAYSLDVRGISTNHAGRSRICRLVVGNW